MIPIHYNEISYYIGKRIKMILCKNINVTYISIYLNLQKTKVKANLNFKICNTEYTYSQIFNINKTFDINDIMEIIIDSIIQDFESKNNLNS